MRSVVAQLLRQTARASFALLVLALLVTPARAELLHQEIDPAQVNPSVQAVRGKHLVVLDPELAPRERLIVYIPGTNSSPAEETPVLDVFARAGYRVIGLDYANGLITTTFRSSPDPAAFDRYRQTINYGGRVHGLDVARASGLATRLTDLLKYLARTQPGWSRFADAEHVAWNKLILVGHSQGAGHAAYLAKRERVAAVLMLAGPQDYLTVLKRPAPWLARRSATPAERFRALLHRDDPYDSKLQLATNQALHPKAKVARFAQAAPRRADILISERPIPTGSSAHVAMLEPDYGPIWLALIEREASGRVDAHVMECASRNVASCERESAPTP